MRGAPFILGIFTLASVWLGPLRHFVLGSFSAHMTMHMVVVALAAPLIALGLAGGKYDPVLRFPAWFPPIPASILEGAIVWAWHAPSLHHFARHSTIGLVAEQASFLASALFVWLSALGGDARFGGARTALGIVALLLTSMHMTLLGALLALPPRPLYAHAGTDALADQHLGGAIMLIAGGVSYLSGGIALGFTLLKRAKATP